MKFRFYFLFLFFSLIFLFYPGDSPYYNILAYNQNSFIQKNDTDSFNIAPIPFTKSNVQPEITAEGVYIVDLPSFTPIYERNPHMQLFPASTTKIITALVAYDIYKPDQVITVKRVLTEGQVMGLFEGERITVENLLYGTLIHSGNDAAFALADAYGMEEFMKLMNQKTQELGMKNSHFDNPTGLDSPSQISSPYDLALAGRALLKNPYLKKMVSIKEITISDIDYKIFHPLSNVNKLLGEVQGLGGLKTGYTENAGENLVSFYKSGEHEFIIVILKSLDRFEDTRTIIRWINEQVEYITVDPTLFND